MVTTFVQNQATYDPFRNNASSVMYANAAKMAAMHVHHFIQNCRSNSREMALARVRRYIPSLVEQLRLLDDNIYTSDDDDLSLLNNRGPDYNIQAGFNLRQTRGAFSHWERSVIFTDATVLNDVQEAWAALEAFAGPQDDFTGLLCIPPIEKTEDLPPTPHIRSDDRPSVTKQSSPTDTPKSPHTPVRGRNRGLPWCTVLAKQESTRTSSHS